MKRRAAVYGVGVGINGREAAMQATQHALDQLGTARPILAMAFAAQELDTQDVLSGLNSLLGETPVWGFSTTRPITDDGEQPRSVVVALLTGSENRAVVHWFPEYLQDSLGTARKFAQTVRQGVFLPQHILVAADGMNGSLLPLCSALEEMPIQISGCMASVDALNGKTYQLGGNQTGTGSLSAAFLSGQLRVGVGLAHGWRDLGIDYHVTRARDVWIQSLDDMPAAEVYARLLGHTAREWAFPPLSEMLRLYPLGIEIPPADSDASSAAPELLIRSMLRVEVDGSLRMSAPVSQGATVHLMTGDPDACMLAARQAIQQALDNLGAEVQPILAIALIDAGWQLLFESRTNAIIDALSSEIKNIHRDIPLVGAYTFGQLVRPAIDRLPVLHNQNLEMVVIGEAQRP